MRIGAVAMAMLLVSTVASGMQDAAVEQDIVVIGRRMRLVRLNYALRGPHLRRCDIEVTSGDARVDGIMCAVLRRCITAGYREPKPAKHCMDASIDLFTSGKRRPPEPDPIGAAAPATRPLPVLAPEQVYTAPAPAATPDGEADIVVEGNRYMPTAGQWRFTRLASSEFGRPSQLRWGRCIPEGEWEVMLRLMLNGEESRSPGGRCGPMKLKLKRGKLTGERSCLSAGSRMKTLVRGSVSQNSVLADETTYLVVSSGRRDSNSVQMPENDSVSKLYGERVGACSASDQNSIGQQPER